MMMLLGGIPARFTHTLYMQGLCAVKYTQGDFSCPHNDSNDGRLVAFILYLTDEYVLTDRYLKAGVATIVVVYLSSFWYWAQYILINPASKFGQTWPELAFRGAATFWLVTAVGILMFRSRGW